MCAGGGGALGEQGSVTTRCGLRVRPGLPNPRWGETWLMRTGWWDSGSRGPLVGRAGPGAPLQGNRVRRKQAGSRRVCLWI